MNRTIQERYKYTAPARLATEGEPGTLLPAMEIEAAPELIVRQGVSAPTLAAWQNPGLECDPLWDEQLGTPDSRAGSLHLRIPRHLGVTDGVIYVHVRYPDTGQTGTAARQYKATLRLLVELEEGTRARLVVHHHSAGPDRVDIDSLCLVRAEPGARLDLVEVTETRSLFKETVLVRQAGDSRVRITCFDLDNTLLRRNQFAELLDREAECDLAGIYLTDGKQHADNFIRIDHASPDCRSNQLFKGVISGDSTAAFTGNIHVAPDAQRTAAFQENHNIVLSDTARIYTRPQLEIYADDVKCSHGATVGVLDPEAIYYMRQRGIAPEAARRLQLEGFIGEVIERCEVEELQHTLRNQAGRRLQHL